MERGWRVEREDVGGHEGEDGRRRYSWVEGRYSWVEMTEERRRGSRKGWGLLLNGGKKGTKEEKRGERQEMSLLRDEGKTHMSGN